MSLIVYCPRPSDGARLMTEGLNALRRRDLWPRNRNPHRQATVINWGSGHHPNWNRPQYRWFNRPESVLTAISKVQTYERLTEAGVPTLSFTTDPGQARRWLNSGKRVLARQDRQSGGAGIRILVGPTDQAGIDNADFFTRYFAKTHEYRAHVVQGRVVDLTQKKRSQVGVHAQRDRTLHQRIIRSHDNGWIFAHEDLDLPGDLGARLSDTAISAVRALGLDFGAVDIAVRIADATAVRIDPQKAPVIKVLEVNTAPGLENTRTINAYLEAFRSVI